MICVLCVPIKWLCGKIYPGCAKEGADLSARLLAWNYAQANEREIWDCDSEKERIQEAFSLSKTDPSAAFQLYLALADQGSVYSMVRIAWSYGAGKGVARDPAKAEEWYRRAFEGGSEYAQVAYTNILGARGELAKCEEVLSVGAAKDWAPALYLLAHYRLRQSKSRQTLKQVRPLLERAADKGSLLAQKELANLMLTGSYGLSDIHHGFRLLIDTIRKFNVLLDEKKKPANQNRPPSQGIAALSFPAGLFYTVSSKLFPPVPSRTLPSLSTPEIGSDLD